MKAGIGWSDKRKAKETCKGNGMRRLGGIAMMLSAYTTLSRSGKKTVMIKIKLKKGDNEERK